MSPPQQQDDDDDDDDQDDHAAADVHQPSPNFICPARAF
jgi:hypothetical protein